MENCLPNLQNQNAIIFVGHGFGNIFWRAIKIFFLSFELQCFGWVIRDETLMLEAKTNLDKLFYQISITNQPDIHLNKTYTEPNCLRQLRLVMNSGISITQKPW